MRKRKQKVNVLRKAWDAIQYAKLAHRINVMSEKQQMLVSQKIYEEAYAVMKLAQGEELGACSVVFSCPYDGHVSFYIEKTLSDRVKDKKDPTIMSEVSKLDDGKWIATVVVKALSEQDAMTMADASVMSAVLKSKTVEPTFAKYLSSVDKSQEPFDSKSVIEEIKNRILDVAA